VLGVCCGEFFDVADLFRNHWHAKRGADPHLRDFSMLVRRNAENRFQGYSSLLATGFECPTAEDPYQGMGPAITTERLSVRAAGSKVSLRPAGRRLGAFAGAVPGIDLFQMDDRWHARMALKLHVTRRLTLRAWEALKTAEGAVVPIAGPSAEGPTAAAVGRGRR